MTAPSFVPFADGGVHRAGGTDGSPANPWGRSAGEIRGRERFFKLAAPNAPIEKGTAIVRFHVHPTIQLYRASANGSDTLAIDARLHGVRLFFTTNAGTDD